MKTVPVLIAGCGLVLALAGCTRNTVIVLAPSPLNGVVPVHCWRPEDKQQAYQIPHAVLRINVMAPKVAAAEHIGGCAAVKFQLTAGGKPRNMTVLRELPAGYGYGEAVARQLGQETFSPPSSPDAWYYQAVSITFTRGTIPVRPFNQIPNPQPAPEQPKQYHS